MTAVPFDTLKFAKRDLTIRLGAMIGVGIGFLMSQNHFETVGRVKSTDERLDNHILHHR